VLLGGDKVALGDLGVNTLTERIDLEISSVETLGADIFITAKTKRKDA